ncbi:Oncosphere antigen A, partial [Taenia solium]
MLLQISLILLATSILHAEVAARIARDVPQNVMMKAIDSHTVIVTWDEPLEYNGTITGYLVNWYLGVNHYGVNRTSDRSFVFRGLEPNQTVFAIVAAVT